MKTIASLIALSAALVSSAIPVPQHPGQPPASVGTAAMARSEPAFELKLAMRKLWEDHITYTRNFIISSLAGLEDADKVAERLLKNQDEIGAAIKPYYGDEAGTKLSALLRDHILIAVDVVKAAKAGNNDALNAAQKKWSANGKDIAAFLSSANKDWAKRSSRTCSRSTST
jgi:hypothetical protein